MGDDALADLLFAGLLPESPDLERLFLEDLPVGAGSAALLESAAFDFFADRDEDFFFAKPHSPRKMM